MMKILTFDIEDWWVYDHYSIGRKEDYLPRLNQYLTQILDLLDEKNIKATFFCLGKVAEEYPNLIKLIAKRGHQIGCHSYSHRFWGEATSEEVAEDTKKALNIIENIIGEKVIAYRAPAFSITEKTKWIFDILVDNGIEYDCSIFPASRRFGGFPNFNLDTPCVINNHGIKIKEFPMSITRIWGKEIAYSGGGYFRLFPYKTIEYLVKKNDYVMTYFHIKDFDKEQKRIYRSFQGESAPINFFKNYYGLGNSFPKFRKLIENFDFESVEKAANNIDWDEVPLVTV